MDRAGVSGTYRDKVIRVAGSRRVAGEAMAAGGSSAWRCGAAGERAF